MMSLAIVVFVVEIAVIRYERASLGASLRVIMRLAGQRLNHHCLNNTFNYEIFDVILLLCFVFCES